ncbi:MAG: osmoprotectant transporter permease [Alphaproteobacteria bacterium]|nr:osmoprotectant transporter permease [Alphaproteobacteria bacterium]
MLFAFRCFLVIDAIALLIALYFFGVGLGDGSVSSFNMGLWVMLLGGLIAIVGGGLGLNAKGQRGLALGLLAVLAVPALLAGLFMLLILILQPRWN